LAITRVDRVKFGGTSVKFKTLGCAECTLTFMLHIVQDVIARLEVAVGHYY